MKLTPIKTSDTTNDVATTLTIDPRIVQNMGVREAPVEIGTLQRTIRAVGSLKEAASARRDINQLVSGWIRTLHAHSHGMRIEKGQPLFDLYSPELSVAVDELIAAKAGNEVGAAESVRALFQAAQEKLLRRGLSKRQVDALSELSQAPEVITFYSPVSGFLTELDAVQGAAVEAGRRVMQITDYSVLWLSAEFFEQDLPFVGIGEHVEATLSATGQALSGEIFFVSPSLRPQTRTAEARIAIENSDLTLRPGMYAEVRLKAAVNDSALLVPREAIIDTGIRKTAFVSLGGGTFALREVSTGPGGDNGLISISSGLEEGERVVVSGQFLLDVESRFREATRKFVAERHVEDHHHHHH